MKTEFEQVLPEDIEKRSFEIITGILGDKPIPAENEAVLKRVIHTSADFDYYDNLVFSEGAVSEGLKALRSGASVFTDTQMAKAGINKKKLAEYGGEAVCYIADEDVAENAKAGKTTRAAAAVNKSAGLDNVIYAIGNAPTALARIYELVCEGVIKPKLIIGVPVGFVNVVESKELILTLDCPYIVAKGRKGGSNIAAAVCNALLYQL